MCVRDIEFTYFYDFSIECQNCSDSVIYFFHFVHSIGTCAPGISY